MATITAALTALGALQGDTSSTDSIAAQKKSTASFADALQSASDVSATDTGETHAEKHAAASAEGKSEFLRYASETPEQRMFDNWLNSQGVSQDQYKALSPQQQQALHDKFEEQMRDKLTSDATAKLASTK